MTPAEAFHVGYYIDNELRARGWSVEQMAARSMVPPETLQAIVAQRQTPDELDMLRIAQAFGTSVRLWHGLNEAWMRHVGKGGK